MYAIVTYEDKNETDYLPMKWLVKKVDVADIKHLIKNKIQMQFYYPTFKNVLKISHAKQKGGADPQTDWIIYHARILSTAENELEARQKSIDAQFSSNIDSDKGGKRKRSRPYRYGENLDDENDNDYHSESSEDESHTTKNHKGKKKPFSQIQLCPPPPPLSPLFQKASMGSLVNELTFKNNRLQQQQSLCISKQSATDQEEPCSSRLENILLPEDMGSLTMSTSFSGQTPSNNVVTKLLSKILASLEEVKQTQKLHSAMIISLQKQQSVDSGITIQQLPAGLTLPFHSFADVDNAEILLKDESVQKILTKVFIENGGSDIGDFVKRNMKLLFDSALAKQYNLTGVSRQGKRGFNKLIMFQLLFVAVKQNFATKVCSQENLENELKSWFSNARDRGKGGRKEMQHPPI